jgi:hypothetical protein
MEKLSAVITSLTQRWELYFLLELLGTSYLDFSILFEQVYIHQGKVLVYIILPDHSSSLP